MQLLEQDIKFLKGVGPGRAKVLADELSIRTVGDLLFNFPYRYIDRSKVYEIRDVPAVLGEVGAGAAESERSVPFVQLRGRIIDFGEEGTGRKRRMRATFTDGTGFVDLVWFRGLKYITETFKVNQTLLLLGRPTMFNGRISFTHPELDKVNPDQTEPQLALQPLYSTTERMRKTSFTSAVMRKLVANAFALLGGQDIDETLPPYFLRQYALQGLTQALHTAHFPTSAEVLPAALHRLKFEELFYLQLDILRYTQSRRQRVGGFRFRRIGEAFLGFYHHRLPFSLTDAQKRVLREIRSDLGSGVQMNRLLQGDVGSGKTVVALMACLIAVDNGFQACIMAPTEILAEQHLSTLRHLLGDMGVRVELLTGIVKGKRRKDIMDGAARGTIDILLGTHALLEPDVRFLNLGLAVIDEQHRFGVKQRAALWDKNVQPPHVLVMTATPIPRTLAMTVYGDLDVSVIDALPPGRKPITTVHYYDDNTEQLIAGIRHQIGLGRQVYVVYPLVKESEKIDLADAQRGHGQFSLWFPECQVGLVHGQMKPEFKDAAMGAFVRGETKILVSTTVIEVGVNVPNASVMVVMNAERFGLSQLHQLRGRVGRGAEQSYCVLVSRRQLSDDTRRRLAIMCETNDGFEIAEEDLRLRGPGDLTGTLQSGMPFDLKVANVVRDSALLASARDAAKQMLDHDPAATLPQNAVIWRQLARHRNSRTDYSDIS